MGLKVLFRECDKMSEPKLKPCPFCGGEANLFKVVDVKSPKFVTYQVHHYCKLFTAHLRTPRDTREGVIKAWNRRPK